MKAFIPKWRQDPNNTAHTYGYALNTYPSVSGNRVFIERHVKYYNKKKKQWCDETIQVIHLGKLRSYIWKHYPVISFSDVGIICGSDLDELEKVSKLIQSSNSVSIELMESISKEYQVYITAVINKIKYVFSPERTYVSDEGYVNG
ncbi:phage protein [Pseudomonas phage PA02]|nr:phage protein [Pseudomonas phage PA02]